jgi:hypothetical protein
MSRPVTTNNLHFAWVGKEFGPAIDKSKTSYTTHTFLLTRIQLQSVQCVTTVGERKSEPSHCGDLQSASQSVALGDVMFLASQVNQYTCDDPA